MQTLYIHHDRDLYEVKARRKDGQPNKILIDEISLFQSGSIATPKKWDELEESVQNKIRNAVRERFSNE